MMSENKGKREAALSAYSYAPPARSQQLHHPGGGSFNIGSGYSFGGQKLVSHLGSGDSHGASSHSHFPGLQSYSPSFGGGSSYPGISHIGQQQFSGIGNGGFRQGGYPRYTSIKGLKAQAGSGGSQQFAEHSLGSTSPQTFGHSFSGAQGQSSFAVPHFASKPSFGFSSGSLGASHGASLGGSFGGSVGGSSHGLGGNIHVPSLPSYSATKGLGAYASSGGFSSSLGQGSPSQAYGSPAQSYGAPSGSYGVPSFGGQLHGGLNSISSFSSGGFGGHNSFSGDGGLGGKHSFEGFFDTGKPTFGHSEISSELSSGHNSGLFSGHSAGLSSGLSSSYGAPSVSDFKPSVYLGSSASSPSSSYGVPQHASSGGGAHATSYNLPVHSQNAASQLGLSSADHEKLLAGTPVFITPKGLGGLGGHAGLDLSSLISQGSQGSHGSPSLSGSSYIPSAGHSAPATSFSHLSGGSQESPSSSYGVPSYHQAASSSDYSSLSHAGSSPSFEGHGSGAGYSTEENQSEGYDHPAAGSDALVTGYSSSTIHGSSNSHVPSSSYGSPASYGAPAASYGVPSYSSSGNGYSGSSGLSFEGIGAGKLELPSASSSQSFSSSSHGGIPASSYGAPSHSFSSPSSSYGLPQETYGAPQGSYSFSEDNQHAQSDTKYNTIKYSRSLSVKDAKKSKM